MTIRLVYSQRTEALVDALTEALSAERAARGPLEPAHLIVPSRNLERHVVLALAERLGVAANLRFHRLESFVGRWLGRELQRAHEGGPPLRVLDRRAFEAFVLGTLLDERFFAHPDAAPLARYVGHDAAGRAASERRLAQLALRVARLFEAYAYSRPELLATWARGGSALDARAPEAAETERWQRRLYVEVRGRAARRGFRPLHEALEMLGDRAPSVGVLPPSVHVVGLSYVARLFQWVFAALGARTGLGLYVLNPCREFWEDVPSESELRARLPRRGSSGRPSLDLSTLAAERADLSGDQRALGERATDDISGDRASGDRASGDRASGDRASGDRASGDPASDALFGNRTGVATESMDAGPTVLDLDPPLLTWWGRPGREHVHLLCELTGADFEARFDDDARLDDDAAPATLLGRVQRDVLERRAAPEEVAPAPDGSIEALGCPGVRREVEVVAEEIWERVRESAGTATPLRFHEIAVLLHADDRDTYLPHVSAVFGEARIPHHVVDLDLTSESRVAEAASLLLDVVRSRFRRPEVLALLRHPVLRVPGGGEEIDRAGWARLIDRLGVFHGRTAGDLAGTYLDPRSLGHARVSWDQGARRLALGAFLTGEASGDEAPFRIPGVSEAFWPEDAERDEAAPALALLVRSLIADARFAERASLTLAGWGRFFRALFEGYLGPRDEREVRDLRRCLSVADAIAGLSIADDASPVGVEVAAELARERLRGLAGARGEYLADGVVVSALAPMRAIPFRVVHALGMGEGRFPTSERRDPLDLRGARRMVGDVTPAERDKYVFLETILCARERFVVSWVARDALTGESIAPSPVVTQLLELLESRYLASSRDLVRKFPLRRHDEERARRVLAQARIEGALARAGAALRAELGRDVTLAELRTLGEGALGALALPPLPAPAARVLGREGRAVEANGRDGHVEEHGLDARGADARVPDARVPDARVPDARVPDARVPDARVPDARVPDARVPDARAAEVGPHDPAPSTSADAGPGAEVLALGALRSFLESPLRGWARAVLGLDAEREDEARAALEDEPFAPGALERASSLREAFEAGLRRRVRPEELHASERVPRLQSRGRWPLGALAQRAAPADERILGGWRRLFGQTIARGGATPCRVRFGAGSEVGESDLVRPVIELSSARRALRVVGRTELLVEETRASLVLLPREPPLGVELRRARLRHALRGFVDYIALVASEDRSRDGHRAVTLYGGDAAQDATVTFGALTPAEARAWLLGLGDDLATGAHDVFLPFEAIAIAVSGPDGLGGLDERSLARAIAQVRRARGEHPGYGPIAGEQDYPAPADALAIVWRRFGLFFRLAGLTGGGTAGGSR